MLFRQINDPMLAQYAYLIACQRSKEALIIDPERDIDQYLDAASAEGLTIVAVAETHIHADFLSGARAFAERGVRLYLSDEGGEDWKYEWAANPKYDVTLLRDGDSFSIGKIEFTAIHTPGHTPEHLSFLVTDHGGGAEDPMGIVTGDFVFVGDLGRPDLLESAARMAGQQEPSARRLFGSVQRFLELPDFLQLWPGHGAGSACGKSLGAIPQSTIGYERRFNAAIDAAARGEDAFVDAILSGQSEPPLYFARMKKLNRTGPPVLDALPNPRRLAAEEIDAAVFGENLTVIDTRRDRSAFMSRHVPGSIYAPWGRSFNTDVGSAADPDDHFALIIDADRVSEAVRALIRVGFDNVLYYSTPAELDAYFDAGGAAASIEHVDFSEWDVPADRSGDVILDVRYKSEFDSAHIPGAINVAYTRLAERLDDIPRRGRVHVHCASGVRSAVAASVLARAGFEVTYVDGDFSLQKVGRTDAVDAPSL